MKVPRQKALFSAATIGALAWIASSIMSDGEEIPKSDRAGLDVAASLSASKESIPLVDHVVSAISKSFETPDGMLEPKTEQPIQSQKLRVLDELLASVSDNDPRMDRVLREFSEEEKSALVERYRGLEKELLNKRGTLVFLAGRELRRVEDLQFMGEVLTEPPCRSLGHCAEDPKGELGPGEHSDENLGADLTLVYPQMVAIHALESRLQKSPSDREIQRIIEILQDTQSSPHPLIANRATEILQKYQK